MLFTGQQTVVRQTGSRKPAVNSFRQQADREIPFTGQQEATTPQSGRRAAESQEYLSLVSRKLPRHNQEDRQQKASYNSYQATVRQDTLHWSAGSYRAAIR
jgi:hypothetical protein